MSVRRTFTMMARDLTLGRRSPFFMAVIVMPLLITALMRLDRPVVSRARLGIVDDGGSEITSAVGNMDGIALTLVKSVSELKVLVENHELDAGLVLPEGFDAKARAGERPDLEFYMSGETYAFRRLMLAVTAIDLVREVEGKAAPVKVTLNTVDQVHGLAWRHWKILFWTLFAITSAGIYVPALMLVEERERGTMSAILVTPAKASEVLVSRAVLGFLMAIAIPYLALILNMALPPRPSALLVTLALAAVICTELGLICGTVAGDTQAVGAFVASLQALSGGTMVLCTGVSWAPWVAKLIPTYWFIGPLYQVAVNGAELEDVRTDLLVALALAAVMAVAIVLLGRRMQARLASA